MTRARDLAAFVSNADGDIKFDTDTLFVDSSANRVGIGKTNPDVPLHIDMGTDNNAGVLIKVIIEQSLIERLSVKDIQPKGRLIQHQQVHIDGHYQCQVQLRHHPF